MTNLLAGNAFQGIGLGRDITVEYQEQLNVPVDGSNEHLRELSPFTLELIIPDIYFDLLQSSQPSSSVASDAEGQRQPFNIVTAVAFVGQSAIQQLGLETAAANGQIETEEERLNRQAGVSGPAQSRTYGGQQARRRFGIVNVANREANDYRRAQSSNLAKGFNSSTGSLSGPTTLFPQKTQYNVKGKIDVGDDFKDGAVTITDRDVMLDIATQIEAMVNAPALTLLINPTSLSISYAYIQQFTERTRYGYLYQAWGLEQPTMSISGVTGAYIAGAPPGFDARLDSELPFPTGVQYAVKKDSAAWQYLMHQFLMYKNNGYIYDTLSKSHAMHAVGSVSITYDGVTYIGNFNSLEFGEADDANQHGKINFTMEFTINRLIPHPDASLMVLPMSAVTTSPSDLMDVDGGTAGRGSANDAPVNQTEGDAQTPAEIGSHGVGDLNTGGPVSAGNATTVAANLGGFVGSL